jgi:uncharacterized protein
MRFLIIGLLLYLAYHLFKAWALPGKPTKRTQREEGMTRIDDVMVKDPFCGIYFPEQKGVKGVIRGKAYYFCSTQCRDKFLESASDAKQSASH